MSASKRKHDAVPSTMVQRWTSQPQPRLSCQNCRLKKWRCDRKHPCNNCRLRKSHCQYSSGSGSHDLPSKPGRHDQAGNGTAASMILSPSSPSAEVNSTLASLPTIDDSNGLVKRIRRLEEAVFGRASVVHGTSVGDQGALLPSVPSTQQQGVEAITAASGADNAQPARGWHGTSFAKLSLSTVRKRIIAFDEGLQDPRCRAECLPPVEQARQLFDQFVQAVQPTFGVLHIPSVRVLMEENYRNLSQGKDPNFVVVILLLSIFAGGALVATPELLGNLRATAVGAKTAFATYTRLSMTMLDYPQRPIAPSTVALLAITTLCHILTHSDGFSDKIQALRMRAIFMARSMQIHRLDTVRRQEERQRTGYEIVEIEVQRRIWWHIVSSDWIVSLSQGPQEGSYLLHPKHMRVNHPRNIDDESLATTRPDYGFPLTTPTCMSVFILRIHFAEICREIVDAFPSMFLGENELPDYDVILDLDRKLHHILDTLPVFLRLDPESVRQSREIITERPYLAWQRTIGHLGIYTRICRLHRPFHREASSKPRFAYSRETCLRFAHRILDLRRTLDETGSHVGLKPANYWMVMQNVFFAAMVLASDVSMYPASLGAETRKQEVLDACKMLEQSRRQSPNLNEAIQKNTQTLLSILQSAQKEQQQHQRPKTNPGLMMANTSSSYLAATPNKSSSLLPQGEANGSTSAAEASTQQLTFSDDRPTARTNPMPWDATATHHAGEESWGQLWSDLFAVAPDIDDLQWDLLLDDWDIPLDTGF
ncbi:Zn(II)2Cys6 transcription factor [Aspergillus homomorphus CBS 101889]|uniref:Zn(2)-C6 fungal-type domain-containing protein n=1 Tax=Aspergillus homomorphus (strain CBS 101889) TaxID=1450537 RepID=A0A395IC47_ASPHC|nr:hypothetical protein BO97DRAFT_359991 [Aspergillus homomorphus CBS 101889]RAL16668.1 hypothetical protein BO97DRAFT_359991 [Aspergillus homomorphus CBS 101889]